MTVIEDVLKEELERLQEMERTYREKLEQLPKGSIVTKKISGKPYNYLLYRVGKKIVTQYLRMQQHEIEELNYKILQRKKYEKILKEIKEEYKLIRKVLKN